MPTVTVTRVSKLYGRFAALRDISCDFVAGRCYAIFGENGAGKSTLLRVIAGLTRPTQGTVKFFENSGTQTGLNPASKQPDRQAVLRKLGYMAHDSMLYDEMSGMENLRYFGLLYGITCVQKLAEAIIMVGLDPALQRRTGDYSQGMRQRLSLARALLHDPQILLLDEPFSNLDIESSREIALLLGKLRDSGKTVLVVTHQATHLEDAADESLFISSGEIIRQECGIGAVQSAPAKVSL